MPVGRIPLAMWAFVLVGEIMGSAGFAPGGPLGPALTRPGAFAAPQVGNRGLCLPPQAHQKLMTKLVGPGKAVRTTNAGSKMCALDTGVLAAVGEVLPRVWLTTLGTVSTDHLAQYLFVGSNIGYTPPPPFSGEQFP